MVLDDIYSAAIIAALFIFSVVVTLLFSRRGKPWQVAEKKPIRNQQSATPDTNGETVHGPAKGVSGEITVTFSKSGKQYPWDPKLGSLLEFAEARGIKIDSQCRAGECGCCQSKLISGDNPISVNRP
ncbi:MAG: 2Fe-2S iron-sulfur cluster binding domain-containing protein [Candidatus Thiodiazotropha sp. (ex Epidulcina cf. delphinae)]|nr:2Fe-2S iron-sulfur cluster binding domain-containing protein [Candidatus Thiodiazotropha sp. (ex Epidulcina cf. delphinae)]